ncbi:hypothetical protein BD779DRAFT_1534268 [Infundibulicybe gibba]|nr:hypothetical protein BD779DRAFT_1534268 [Infundibulicybe gibba]
MPLGLYSPGPPTTNLMFFMTEILVGFDPIFWKLARLRSPGYSMDNLHVNSHQTVVNLQRLFVLVATDLSDEQEPSPTIRRYRRTALGIMSSKLGATFSRFHPLRIPRRRRCRRLIAISL